MPRNGSGVYSLPSGSVVANGDTSDASDINTPLADIVTDLNTARPISVGGTGASSASAARTALGLAIGTNVQAYNATLTTLASATAAGLALMDDADAAAQLTTLGAAPLDSPTFTGVPAAPTAAVGTNTTQLATTAFALAQVIDEDDFATDSATRPPSQQSAKAYIAAQIAAIPTPSAGCVFLATADLASDATADFTLTSGYDAYMFVLQNVIPATDNVGLRIAFSPNGGSTMRTATLFSSWNDAGGGVVGRLEDIGSAAGEDGVSGQIAITGAALSSNTGYTFSGIYQDASARVFGLTAGGQCGTAEASDFVRFTFSSGNLESGTITLYGFKNA